MAVQADVCEADVTCFDQLCGRSRVAPCAAWRPATAILLPRPHHLMGGCAPAGQSLNQRGAGTVGGCGLADTTRRRNSSTRCRNYAVLAREGGYSTPHETSSYVDRAGWGIQAKVRGVNAVDRQRGSPQPANHLA
jgi:hypothetical protein